MLSDFSEVPGPRALMQISSLVWFIPIMVLPSMNMKKSFFFVSRCVFLQHCIASVWKCYGWMDFSGFIHCWKSLLLNVSIHENAPLSYQDVSPAENSPAPLPIPRPDLLNSFLELIKVSGESLRNFPESLTAMFELSRNFSTIAQIPAFISLLFTNTQ